MNPALPSRPIRPAVTPLCPPSMLPEGGKACQPRPVSSSSYSGPVSARHDITPPISGVSLVSPWNRPPTRACHVGNELTQPSKHASPGLCSGASDTAMPRTRQASRFLLPICLPPSEALPHQTAYDVAVGPAPAPASSDVDDPPHPAVLSRFKQASGTFSHAMALLRCTLHANLAPPATEHATAGPLHCWNATPFLFLFYFDQGRKPGPGTNEVKRTAGYRRRFPASENAHCTQTCSISPDFPCGREQRQDVDRGSRVVPPFCLPCGVLPLPVAGEEPAID
jgi:hypothetical protein